MLIWIRSFIFFLGYFFLTIFYGTFTLSLFITPTLTRHKITIFWCRMIIAWAKIICGIRYQVVGMEHIQSLKTPVIVLSKHQSAWETLFLQSLFFPASTILKKELLSIPFFGWGLRGLQPIGIDRNNPKQALREVKSGGLEKLAIGNNLLLFPEGTRMPPGERGKYARSGADIAISANTPVIPVAVNAGYFWPSKSFIKKPGLVQVVIGEPIHPENKTSRELIQQVENWIENTLHDLENL